MAKLLTLFITLTLIASLKASAASPENPKDCTEILASSTEAIDDFIPGLSEDDVVQLRRLSAFSPFIKALEESFHYFTNVVSSNLGLIRFKSPKGYAQAKSAYENAGLDFEEHLGPPRPFPQDFFDSYLKTVGASEALLKKQFGEISGRFPQEAISSEAILILAYTARTTYNAPISPSKDPTLELVQTHIKREEARRRLPNYNDFFNNNPGLLAYYLGCLVIVTLPEAERPAYWRGPKHLEHIEKFHLAISGKIQLIDKINAALETLEPEFAQTMRTRTHFISALTLNNQNFPRLNKWLEAGSYFLKQELMNFFQDYLTSATSDNESLEDVAEKFVNQFNINQTKDRRFLSELFLSFMNQAYTLDAGPTTWRRNMFAELTKLGHFVRSILKDIRYQEQLKEQAELSARMVVNTPSFSLSRSGTPQVQRHHLGRVRTSSSTIEVATAPAETQNVNAISLQSLLSEDSSASESTLYFFTPPASVGRQVQFVRISAAVIAELQRKNFAVQPWVRAFLAGPATHSRSGIRRILDSSVWEIKLTGSSFRILLKQEKQDNTWMWLELVHHDNVYRQARRY